MAFLLSIANVLVLVSLSWAGSCPHLPGYTVHGISCFRLYTNSKTWTDAEASCVADGGHLASIHSSEEQAFVSNLVGAGYGPWIGLSGTLPNLAWSDGRFVDYDNWMESEPDENGVTCAKLRGRSGHSWQDKTCSDSHTYLCRFDESAARFTKVRGGVDTDSAVSPCSTQTVRSRVECAWRCQQDSGCKHFTLTGDGAKYLCETYTTLYRTLSPGLPPNDNNERIYP